MPHREAGSGVRRARRSLALTFLAALAVAGAACGPGRAAAAASAPEAARGEGPALVLLIVVDQLGAEEMQRLGPSLRHGIRYVTDHGLRFEQAFHAHAVTETAPGHASLVTGRFPRGHGIIGNWWIESGSPVKRWATDDDEFGDSPARLLASAFGDWLKASRPRAKVFAVGGKERAAIMMGGRRPDGAFWFDDEVGGMATSAYYREPTWLPEFRARRSVDRYFGRLWEPLPLSPAAIDELQIEELELGPLRGGFPHVPGRARPAPDEDFYHALRDSPWLDSYVAEFARFLLEAEELGADDVPDLLALAFSASDYVGHDYGPHSREYVDVLLRLDRTLGELLELVDQRVGLDRTVIAFSSDHGVVPVPEIRRRRGLAGRRVDSEVTHCVQQVGELLARRHGVEKWLVPGPVLAPDLTRRTGLSREVLERETAAALERCPGVAEVWTRSELLPPAEESEGERWLFANNFHPDRSPDFLIRFDEYLMTSRETVSTHGSPYAYDRRVPLIIVAPGLAPGAVEQPVRTVDLAPTLAALLGIQAAADLDGRDLSLLFRPHDPRREAATR